MEIKKVYPLDAVFDNPDDVPEDVRERIHLSHHANIQISYDTFFFLQVKANKRYAGSSNWTVQV